KFVEKDSDKGPQAESIIPVKDTIIESSSNNKVDNPATLEERFSSLESSVAIWKVLSMLALTGVLALVVEKFIA
ncbi:MAG: hypothetical protein HKM28_05345, partial [Flavobacteriaceae bacterium]|nr:hypothetical protein [Flavobacteriaceae bacterium]